MSNDRTKVLREIIHTIVNLRVVWIVAGEAAGFLLGIREEFGSISIITSGFSAHLIERELNKRRYKKLRGVNLVDSRFFVAYYGEYEAKGLQIKIFGDLAVKFNQFFVKFDPKKLMMVCKTVNINGVEILVAPPEIQLLISKFTNHDGRRYSKFLENYIKSRGIDEEVFIRLKEAFPESMINKVFSWINI